MKFKNTKILGLFFLLPDFADNEFDGPGEQLEFR